MKKVRKRSKRKKVKKQALTQARNINQIIKENFKYRKMLGSLTLVALIIIISVFYYNSTYAQADYIVVDGQKVGLVSSKEKGKELIQTVLQEYGQAVGQTAKTNHRIEYQHVKVKNSTLFQENIKKDDLKNKLDPFVEGYAIKVSGKIVAQLPSSNDAAKVLDDLKKYYTQLGVDKQVTSVEFLENVTTEKLETKPDAIQAPDHVLDMLKKGKQSSKEYIVQENDSLWLIARKSGMHIEEVLNNNSDLSEDTVLQPGQKIKLVSVTPYINVMIKGEYSSTEKIPFDVIIKTDYNLKSGQSKVNQLGSDGSKVVTYSFVQKNDNFVEKKALDEQIIKKPVDQVLAQGPKVLAKAARAAGSASLSRGNGKSTGFIWPLRGQITSYFGWRSRGFHYGLDIDGYTGQPIAAVAAGKVVSAGWNGRYGRSILIDHGNGVATRYSHASKLLISPGQSVRQGQTIALVGSTGNSTGSHLDFEVIVNSTNHNPLNYLP